jgi:nucleotide-binding universal stress UspA family protein
MTTYQGIVCATDLSAASALAVRQADELAQRLGATLHLLHVVQDPLLEPWSPEAYVMNVEDLTQEWVSGAERDLAALAANCSSTTITACRVGRPVQQILEYVNDVNADLLVVGSHGHGFVAHMILGSVAERLVRLAPCPVLTVRAAAHAGSTAPESATSTPARV